VTGGRGWRGGIRVSSLNGRGALGGADVLVGDRSSVAKRGANRYDVKRRRFGPRERDRGRVSTPRAEARLSSRTVTVGPMPPSNRYGPGYVALVAAISAEIEDGLAVLRNGVQGRERNALQAEIAALEAQLHELLLLRQGADACATRAELVAAERQEALQGAAATLSPAEPLPQGSVAVSGALFQAARELGRARARGRLPTPTSPVEWVVGSSRRH
jgi:hypothetical protein